MRSFHGGPSDRKGYHHGNLKEALVEAARRFIAERGIVGVTPAALYRHFSGRDALVGEVAGRGFVLLAERLGRAVRGGGTAIERFTRMGEAYLAFAEEEPGFYAAMFSPRGAEEPPSGPWGPPPGSGAPPRQSGAFALLVEALTQTFPEGFGGVDPRFIALEVWALSHGIATLDAAGQLPKGPGLPDKYELLRAGVMAIVHGARSPHGGRRDT
jgi:AcrR family transcriptional regulator